MKTPPIVSAEKSEAAHQEMLLKEKELTRARDALAALRRRMPCTPVEKPYRFEGPEGTVSLFDLFHGRRQLIIYRAFFEPGVEGWPVRACRAARCWPTTWARSHISTPTTRLWYSSLALRNPPSRAPRRGWLADAGHDRTGTPEDVGRLTGRATRKASPTNGGTGTTSTRRNTPAT
jgi:predicted dithiol-disulfide oxidoreductase (DUF899 family)